MKAREWVRDALSGRFTGKQDAEDRPGGTVVEDDAQTKELADLRWRVSELESIMGQASGDLSNMAMHGSITPDRLRKVAEALDNARWRTNPQEEEQG